MLILGLLRMTHMHGYVLNAHIGSMSPVTLKKPATYNLLDSMERDGWVEHRDESTGDRQRKVFSITTAGEKAFMKLLHEQLGSYTPNESPSMVGLSFLDVLPKEETLEFLQQKRRLVLEYRSSNKLDIPFEDSDSHNGSMQLPLEYARRLVDLDLTFIDEIIDDISRQINQKEDHND